MDIVGVTVLKNATKMGYPWVEAILTALPFCDHFHISEGLSEDNTWDILLALQAKHDKISLSRYGWATMETGFAIGDATNYALSCVRHLGGKILYVQADELWHPESLVEIRRLASEEDYDAYNIPYLHLEHNCQVVQEGAGYKWAVRVVANKEGITAHRDAWTFEGYEKLLQVHSLPHPLVHCNYCFWDNIPTKKRIQADELYTDLGHYQQAADLAEEAYTNEVPEMFLEKGSPFAEHLSPLFLPMLGERRYYVREELLT